MWAWGNALFLFIMEIKKLKTKPLKSPSQFTEKQKKMFKGLEDLKGLGARVWKEDAQVYVNRLRSNDRF